MTYTVSSGTLNLTQLNSTQLSCYICSAVWPRPWLDMCIMYSAIVLC